MSNEPLTDPVMKVAMDAATEQFTRMPSSNPWNYARAVVQALREAGMTNDEILARAHPEDREMWWAEVFAEQEHACSHLWHASRVEVHTAPVEHVCAEHSGHDGPHACPCGAEVPQ